jgi:hypothetical protein
MKNGLAFVLLGFTGLVLATTSCGSDEATNTTPSCKGVGQSYSVVNSDARGACCAGLSSSCTLTQMTDPDTGITVSNGTCTCREGGSVLGGGGSGGSSGGTAGKGGSSGTGGSAPVAGFGRACTNDAACGDELLTCLTNTGLADGGPAGGLCTRACTSDTQCLEISNNSFCVNFTETEAYCLEACTTGSIGVPKCQQRPDVACTLIGLIPNGQACSSSGDCGVGELCSTTQECGAIVTGCVPNCGGDFDCGSGQFCDYATGFCTNTEPDGLAIGEPCTPPEDDTDPDPCQGFCIASDDERTEGFCTAFCTFNPTFSGCGWDGVSADPNAGCLFGTILSPDDLGEGDVGICGTLCDCNDDCALSGERCVDESGGAINEIFGRNGYCRPLNTGETEADTFSTCPGSGGTGGSGGSSGTGGTDNGGQGGA